MMPAFDNALLGAPRGAHGARRMLPDLRQMLVGALREQRETSLSRRKEFHILEKWCFATKARFAVAWNPRS
jgi:hypothetical protein